jgi:phage tail sheath protein FI
MKSACVKQVPVQRLALYIEESIHRDTHWAVFEPNSEATWALLRLNIEAFMGGLFRRGMLAGRTAAEAFYVKCGKETMTQTDILQGVIRIEVGFAPLQPAEFVAIKIEQGLDQGSDPQAYGGLQDTGLRP